LGDFRCHRGVKVSHSVSMSGLGWDQNLVSAWLDWVAPHIGFSMSRLGGSKILVAAWLDGVKPQKLVSALLDWPYQLILAWLEIVVFDVF
jgi:hypothetical protein